MRIVKIAFGALLLLLGIWGIIGGLMAGDSLIILTGRIAILLFGIILITWGIQKK